MMSAATAAELRLDRAAEQLEHCDAGQRHEHEDDDVLDGADAFVFASALHEIADHGLLLWKWQTRQELDIVVVAHEVRPERGHSDGGAERDQDQDLQVLDHRDSTLVGVETLQYVY
jgi:hypothetical protein